MLDQTQFTHVQEVQCTWESGSTPQGPNPKSQEPRCWRLQKFWWMENSGWQNTGEPDSTVGGKAIGQLPRETLILESPMAIYCRELSETMERLPDSLGRKFHSQPNKMVFK